jgi:hypothetical protein
MNSHLNLFKFFNDNENHHYEDNLSRAFAICLKNDLVLLDRVLNEILDNETYKYLFSNDFPDYFIDIDLQKTPEKFGTHTKIFGIASSTLRTDVNSILTVIPNNTIKPEIDLSIEIKDVCIIFEFKRVSIDCSAQLKRQVDAIKQETSPDAKISFKDLNWEKIVEIMQNVLSFQRQMNSENIFTLNFSKYLEQKSPQWFPIRLLKEISFPNNDLEIGSSKMIISRLNQLKDQVANIINSKTIELTGKYNRKSIEVDFKWANEVQVDISDFKQEKSLIVSIFPADTKSQGCHYFPKNATAKSWPSELCGFRLTAEPYLKFSHFNSMLFWKKLSPEEYQKTHTLDFFQKIAGRYKKEKWPDFEYTMNLLIPNWKNDCDYNSKLTNSNRTYFDLSLGILLNVYIPFKEAQELDMSLENSELALKFSEVILGLKSLINS